MDTKLNIQYEHDNPRMNGPVKITGLAMLGLKPGTYALAITFNVPDKKAQSIRQPFVDIVSTNLQQVGGQSAGAQVTKA